VSGEPEAKRDVPCYRDYVIKGGVFIGKFEEMYRDVPDPWGCVEKVNGLSNRLLLSLLQEYAPRDRALDAGCGLGVLTALIVKTAQAREVSACDLSATAIEKAKVAAPGVRFFVHDLGKDPVLPFPDGHFSLITMAEVVWYILPVIQAVCNEFCRLLSPSGRLVIKQAFLPPGQQKYGNDIVSKPADLLQFVRRAGFSVEREILLSETNGEQVSIFSARLQA
jgi:SAM-dependent methyltransferase